MQGKRGQHECTSDRKLLNLLTSNADPFDNSFSFFFAFSSFDLIIAHQFKFVFGYFCPKWVRVSYVCAFVSIFLCEWSHFARIYFRTAVGMAKRKESTRAGFDFHLSAVRCCHWLLSLVFSVAFLLTFTASSITLRCTSPKVEDKKYDDNGIDTHVCTRFQSRRTGKKSLRFLCVCIFLLLYGFQYKQPFLRFRFLLFNSE